MNLIPLLAILLIVFLFYTRVIPKNKVRVLNNISSNLPKHLLIPAIGVSSLIQQTGVDESGEMEVPSRISELGWYKLGTIPGEQGSAVISGHLNGKNGEAGVFKNLESLKKGDKIFVTNDVGNTLVFIVTGSSTYNPGYAEEVFTKNNGTFLNLITCYGEWSKSLKSYSKRIIVFSTLEPLVAKSN